MFFSAAVAACLPIGAGEFADLVQVFSPIVACNGINAAADGTAFSPMRPGAIGIIADVSSGINYKTSMFSLLCALLIDVL